MEDLNNNGDVQEQVREEVNTTQKMGKESTSRAIFKKLRTKQKTSEK